MMVYNPYQPNPDDRIDPVTGLPFSQAQLAFGASQKPNGGMLKSLSDARETSWSPMSGGSGGFGNRGDDGAQTGAFSLDGVPPRLPPKPADGGVFGPNPTHPIGMAPIPRQKPAGPRSTPKPDAQPAMTEQQQYEAAMRGYGAMKPAQPGQDYKMATAGYNAIKGDAAQPQQQYNDAMAGYSAMKGAEAQPRPDRGFLQSLSDGFGDAVSGFNEYVQNNPNLGQLGINMMAAANAPSKSEQWQQFAGSFDKFGQANRLDEDRKLEKEDRALRMEDRLREIERQKRADERTEIVNAREDQQFDWTKDDRAILVKNRNATREAREAAIAAEQNPRRKQFLMSLTDDNYGVLMAEEYMAEEAARRAREQDDRNYRRSKADRAAEREDERTARREEGMFAMGMSYLDKSNQVLPSMQATVTDLNSMEQIVNRLTELGAQGGIVTGDFKKLTETLKAQTAGRKEGYDEVIGLITRFENLQSNIVAERAQALKPVSNADFTYFAKVTPNADMPTSGALSIIRDLRDSILWDIGTNNFATEFLQKHGGLSGVLVDGKTWIELRGVRPTLNTKAYGGAPPSTIQTYQKLPPPGEYKDVTMMDENGQQKRSDGTQWIPVGKAKNVAGSYVGGFPTSGFRRN